MHTQGRSQKPVCRWGCHALVPPARRYPPRLSGSLAQLASRGALSPVRTNEPIRHLAHLLDCRGASGRLLQEAGTQHLPRLAFHSPPTASVCSSRRLRPRRSSSSASRPPVGKSSLWTEKRGSVNLWGKSRGQREIRRGGLFRRILTA